MPAFVVLEHDHPVLHWDLMLDNGAALRTWRLAHIPAAGVVTTCESLPDHRRAYLEYEGPVSGGRGTVHRVMAGEYEVIEESPARLGLLFKLDHDQLEAVLEPAKGKGIATIVAGR